MILLPVTQEDLIALGGLVGSAVPNLKISIYKNRRGKYKSVYLWCVANLGQCKVNPIFMTTFGYEPIEVISSTVIAEKGEK